MCHEKPVNIFIEINRKRNNEKNNLTRVDSTRLDSKVFRNALDSNRFEKWLDSPIPEFVFCFVDDRELVLASDAE
jgi:hypothetical protein